MPPIIRIENIGKRYIISHEKPERYQRFSELLLSPFRRRKDSGAQEEFWALKDINFEIGQGDRVGIIGRNGAGKSTLLKVLSKITVPTTGKISVNGRIASLLEVGTGFHPELSGRENIYLNGAILGMKHAEVKKKFDEIVDFAGVEKFLDTPVKRYSSGMYVRLAFAVAAHLEPEILVVDEVLAVGDAEFQKKCLGKMEDISKGHGRTILFVSHNMGAIQTLCNKGILLSGGVRSCTGNIDDVIQKYRNQNEALHTKSLSSRTNRGGDGSLRFADCVFLNKEEASTSYWVTGSDAGIKLKVVSEKNFPAGVNIALGVNDLNGTRICYFDLKQLKKEVFFLKGEKEISFYISKLPLQKGCYTLNLFASCDNVILDWLIDAVKIDVVNGAFYSGNQMPAENSGLVAIDYKVEV